MNLLSFSLFGAQPIYCEGAVLNAALAPRIYPGWQVRVYVDAAVPAGVTERLRGLGCEVVLVEKSLGPEYGKFWRFLVAGDSAVEHFACRDADSRLNVREKAAVDAWIASGATFHVMRDSIHHTKRVLGGMLGGKGGTIPDIAARIDAWGRYERWGDSDAFLSEEIWPLIADRCLVHDSWGHFDGIHPFPAHPPLEGTSYVGEIVPVDRPPFDVWREVGVLQDRLVCYEAEIDHRDARIAALESEAERQRAEVAAVRAELARVNDVQAEAVRRRTGWRRLLAFFE